MNSLCRGIESEKKGCWAIFFLDFDPRLLQAHRCNEQSVIRRKTV